MKDKREFSIGFKVKNGRMDIDRAEFEREIRQSLDGDYTLTITEGGEKRGKSWLQVKYWWPVPVKILAEHCGYTPAQMHYVLLGEWSGWVDGPNGKPIPAKPSMSDYSLEEMNQIIDWVLIFGPSELECVIPEPDKDWRKHRNKGRAA